jgi:hypothetical protein
MTTPQQLTLATRAIADIDQLLNGYDLGGQIESALPLLCQHQRTLVRLLDSLRGSTQPDSERWADDLVRAYTQLGGSALHESVYRKMKKLRSAAGRSWPSHAEEAIRQTLQAHCAKSPQYSGGRDLFRMVRPGRWGLKDR